MKALSLFLVLCFSLTSIADTNIEHEERRIKLLEEAYKDCKHDPDKNCSVSIQADEMEKAIRTAKKELRQIEDLERLLPRAERVCAVQCPPETAARITKKYALIGSGLTAFLGSALFLGAVSENLKARTWVGNTSSGPLSVIAFKFKGHKVAFTIGAIAAIVGTTAYFIDKADRQSVTASDIKKMRRDLRDSKLELEKNMIILQNVSYRRTSLDEQL